VPVPFFRSVKSALSRDGRVRLRDDGAVALRLGEFLFDDRLGDRLGRLR
jgi:hypothetical protein